MMLANIKYELKEALKLKKINSAIYFKTGIGDYAEGDEFIGVPIPALRKIAQKFLTLNSEELQQLISSKINEERLLALIILTHQYKKSPDASYEFYLRNLSYVNNWNLVDSSAHLIIGAHLFNRDRNILLELARSKIMWERRVSMVATWYFIRHNDLEWSFKIARMLLDDQHDLIHKATGWMLREAGKKNQGMLIEFLDGYASKMPRTMLRYSIEKFPEDKRQEYLMRKNI